MWNLAYLYWSLLHVSSAYDQDCSDKPNRWAVWLSFQVTQEERKQTNKKNPSEKREPFSPSSNIETPSYTTMTRMGITESFTSIFSHNPGKHQKYCIMEYGRSFILKNHNPIQLELVTQFVLVTISHQSTQLEKSPSLTLTYNSYQQSANNKITLKIVG